MAYAPLPTEAPIAVPDRKVANPLSARLPKLKLSPAFTRWLSGLTQQVDAKTAVISKAVEPDLSDAVAVTPLQIADVTAGIWRVSTRVRVITPGSVSSSIQVTVTWSESGVTQAESGAALNGNLTTTREGKTFVIRPDASTPISYSTAYADGGGAQRMHYSLDVVAERLAADQG